MYEDQEEYGRFVKKGQRKYSEGRMRNCSLEEDKYEIVDGLMSLGVKPN